MKANCKLALTLLVGTALGATAIQGLHAQTKPPSYVIVDITEVTDAEGYKAVSQRPREVVAADLQEFGGRFIANTGKITALDGAAPRRIVIVAFESTEKAQTWVNSKNKKGVDAIRINTTKSRSFIIEGM